MSGPEPVALSYELHLLPAGRVNFRRWRWAVWHGATLLAAGWCLDQLQAQRKIRVHAVRYAHRVNGLRVLRPDVDHPMETPWRGGPVQVDWGEMRIALTPVPRGQSRRDRAAGRDQIAAS